ncbi:carboxypeptidase-like regulatory domain-containing protein [Chitinolyticbacter meiyuanensis]|uniref:carboxypeptidase-like regulatory domain-containing protein n=1 Tax=Chitinolyticbacter meiyuanensis TaxID=682798 RepID=UPI0011E5DF4E|nr:carboxypeptidase-like regulatory domain-containing protein [Chitinolyticbacter meiyuanensis]
MQGKRFVQGCLALLLTLPAWAADPLEPPRFVSGGVGDEELAALQAVKPQYNLQLMTTEKSGGYLAGVKVTIQDGKGQTVLDTVTTGPYLFVQLPDGRYQLSADYDGKVVKRAVGVHGQKARTLHLTW